VREIRVESPVSMPNDNVISLGSYDNKVSGEEREEEDDVYSKSVDWIIILR
jgi:hypothetical protein